MPTHHPGYSLLGFRVLKTPLRGILPYPFNLLGLSFAMDFASPGALGVRWFTPSALACVGILLQDD